MKSDYSTSAVSNLKSKSTICNLKSAISLALLSATAIVGAQQQGTLTAAERTRRIETEHELQSLAVVERKVMMPMRMASVSRPTSIDRSTLPARCPSTTNQKESSRTTRSTIPSSTRHR
jgi:hypothetical protein